ncbi:MAG: outer membrane protein assembly factor BamC [Nitrosomonadaceae bacterium]|nr:outer membrane protein assembly factor BamC [Nitrosomonadaceae bacterium]
MRWHRTVTPCLALMMALAVTGCNLMTLLPESKKMDYKSAGKLPPLEVPPDLTAPGTDERYIVPDINPSGSATYSAYNKERTGNPGAGSTSLLPASDDSGARIERAGTQRWLVVKGEPETVWPIVKEFWQELGFIINVETPAAGVMETDWAENRANIPQDIIRSILSKVLDSLYSTGQRDKFRTRLERGEAGTTEIYISHRGMDEVLEGNTRTVWQPRPADQSLEAEMLARLMMRFGVEEARARTAVASLGGGQERARIDRERGGVLTLNEAFDRSWRRVGLALDRVGFTVEDRDRSEGIYFVRYVNPDKDNDKGGEGMLAKLAFWRSEAAAAAAAKPEQYRIQVSTAEAGSEVKVLNQEGAPEKSATATKILNLLYEQLK